MWINIGKLRSVIRKTISLSLCLGLGLCLSGCAEQTTSGSTAEYLAVGSLASETTYRTTESYTGDFLVTFEASTRLTALRTTELYWSYSGDKYVNIPVREGDFVSAGDVLAEIEPSISEADRLEKELAVTRAVASRDSLTSSYEQNYAQKRAAVDQLTGTEREMGEKELERMYASYMEQYYAATEGIISAKRSLETLETHAAETQIVAPYDGYVADIIWGWKEGSTVPTNQPLLVLADVQSVAIKVTNPSAYGNAPYLSQVELIDQRDQKVYSGTIVSGAAVTGEKTDELIIIPDLTREQLGTALMGAIRVKGTIIDEKNVVLMSSDALYKDGDTYYVLVLKEDNALSKTYVTVGGISGGIAWITDGLQAGETLVLN